MSLVTYDLRRFVMFEDTLGRMLHSRITLRELARVLNLSPTTVSRALNGYTEVNIKTRERVQAAAQQLGYFPNQNARRLAHGKTGSYGLFLSVAPDHHIDPLLAEFLGGVMKSTSYSETDITIRSIPREEGVKEYQRAIAQKSFDGFIVSSPSWNDPLIQALSQTRFPFILHGRVSPNLIQTTFDYYDIDNYGAFFKATDFLIEKGHQRIGFLGGCRDLTFTHHRLSGTRDALEARGLVLRDDDIHEGPMTEQLGYLSAMKYFDTASKDRPSAFLCLSLYVAIGVLRAGRERGLRLPEDYSLIVHDDRVPYLKAEYFHPPLTALQSSIREAGFHVAEMLRHRIENPLRKAQQVVKHVDLVIRESVGNLA